ncbi:centrosomal protein CCDC61 [Anabrus simplex]|uniref:centrosomal protein CCDC61 n=1 Tax=Anabrus simplex TaxID=316456 RepID=UPI0035A38B99
MMSDQPNLVTTCTFKGKEYLVKMNIISGNSLEMSVTDKYTTEEWQCCYDANYIENITHKTGNFKQFDIFTTMLKSGLLKTSECVSLDLLTYDDLEMLRNRRMNGRNLCPSHSVHTNNVNSTSNRRYLILTYSVEFDRIHYPLPMEYCGPPDPQVLQGIIHRLEGEVERLQEQLKKQAEQYPTNNTSHISKLQKRIEDLSAENKTLSEDVRYLNKALSKHSNSMRHIGMMKGIVNSLQEQVIRDRMTSHRQIKRLQEEKAVLKQQHTSSETSCSKCSKDCFSISDSKCLLFTTKFSSLL